MADHQISDDDTDFDSLHEGSFDPTLNKTIQFLIMQDTDFLVYLDQDLFVEWSIKERYGAFAADFGMVVNRASYLEMLTEVLPPARRLTLQRLIGESVARILDDRHSKDASAILDRVESILCSAGRYRYIVAASVFAIVAAIFLVVLWAIRTTARETLGVNAFDVIVASAMGVIGALLSIVMRASSVVIDPSEPAMAHYAEGSYRALAGGIGALLVGLAIKANVILGFASRVDHGVALMALLGVVAGVSERLVPTLVRRVEDSLTSGPTTPKGRKARRSEGNSTS